jgi:hypothetical protein
MHVVVMSGPPARRSGDEDAPAAGVNDLPSRRFVLTDEATGQLFAPRTSGVDPSALVGQRVTVAGYENRQVEGAPLYWTLPG